MTKAGAQSYLGGKGSIDPSVNEEGCQTTYAGRERHLSHTGTIFVGTDCRRGRDAICFRPDILSMSNFPEPRADEATAGL